MIFLSEGNHAQRGELVKDYSAERLRDHVFQMSTDYCPCAALRIWTGPNIHLSSLQPLLDLGDSHNFLSLSPLSILLLKRISVILENSINHKVKDLRKSYILLAF